MRRWTAIGFIGTYLSVLLLGLTSHTLNFGVSSHPTMYYLVWDMFCGWASYASQIHVLGEGESGRYYELAPGPWGGFKPWGEMDRANYDVYGKHCGAIALNTLKHSSHEPISRIFVVEESWCKKYDLPAVVWAARFEEPQRRTVYCRTLAEMTGDGQMLRYYPPWLSYLSSVAIASNPRLQDEERRYLPMMLVDRPNPDRARDLTLPSVGTSSRMIGGTIDGN